MGRVLYWTATIIAGLIVVAVVAGYVSNAGEGVPFISITALMLAGAIWLVGLDLPQSVRWTLKFVRRNQTDPPRRIAASLNILARCKYC